jgi:hypothetical protein
VSSRWRIRMCSGWGRLVRTWWPLRATTFTCVPR